MKTHLQKLWDSLRSTYWFMPLLMSFSAVVVWLGTRLLDNALTQAGRLPLPWLYNDDFNSIRTLLLTIIATMIGVIGVVFSIVMVPLTLAASQFGPRLLRNFLRDTYTQVTLGLFTATITFCLLVLLQLRTEDMEALPQVSINVALLLGLASFGVLIYFISHVATSIQAPVLASEVSDELHAAIEREFPHAIPAVPNASPVAEEAVPPGAPDKIILAEKSGYVQVRDDNSLLTLAQKENMVIQLLREPGDFMVAGTPLVRIWCAVPLKKEVAASINEAFIVGAQRTLVQDVTFGINELVEMAVRALSPAINDPFTAMTCLDWLGTALCRLCTRALPQSTQYDSTHMVRLITNPVTFTQLTDAAFNQIREYGRTSTAVLVRLLETIIVVAQCACTEGQRRALLHHAGLVERSCHMGLPEEADRALVVQRYQTAVQLLKP